MAKPCSFPPAGAIYIYIYMAPAGGNEHGLAIECLWVGPYVSAPTHDAHLVTDMSWMFYNAVAFNKNIRGRLGNL